MTLAAGVKRLAANYLYGWTFSCLGLAIGRSDPFWLIMAAGTMAAAIHLHIGSITPRQESQHGHH